MARNSQTSEKFLEVLETTPFIHHASKKVGIGRATIYRWMKDHPEFKKKVEKAMSRGRDNLVELAESVLVKKIHKEDLGAVKYFLSHNSKRYRKDRASRETGIEVARPRSAFRDENGKVIMKPKTRELYDKIYGEEERKEEEMKRAKERMRRRALGMPDDPPKDTA
jgi:transposase